MQGLYAIFAFFAAALGATIGSFLNVVIWRVPRGESIVSPPSHCPKCNSPIKWYENIPILSWLALRGRCSNCRAPISPRYIFVEALTAGLFLAVWLTAGEGVLAGEALAMLRLAVLWIWVSLMVTGSFIDYDLQLLPDFVTVGGMALGLASALAEGLVIFATRPAAPILASIAPLIDSAIGLAFGFGLLWLVRFLGTKAFRREAMGMGDVFLMGAVGAVFGAVAVLFTLVVAAILGSAIGVALILLSKAKIGSFKEIPFGPFLCLGCLAWMFFGPAAVNWYITLLTKG